MHLGWSIRTDIMENGVQRYHELIGQIRWAVEIRRLDILLETFLLSSYLAMSRVGRIEQSFHIFGYFKAHQKRELGFYPEHPAIK